LIRAARCLLTIYSSYANGIIAWRACQKLTSVSFPKETMSEGADALLSELCAICHTNPLKYKCPRCGIQTCSLACVKRHKLWSQCSGLRNPAAYRKRGELATPASVDQDYNFITSVERSLARADDEATERGLNLNDAVGRKFVKGQRRTNIEIANSGAIVLKAPEGMSRNKQNRSRWNMKHRFFTWTVEWMLPDGTKSLANARASTTVGEAFTHTIGGKVLRERKRCEEDALTKAQEEHGDPLSGLHFYLHSPNTPSAIKSLIPVMTDARIEDIVKDRLLLEFPTIFVLYHPPDKLPKPFILEADYAKHNRDEAPLIAPIDQMTETNEGQGEASSQIDEKRLFEVLQKDLVS
jgi:hypothetical protein